MLAGGIFLGAYYLSERVLKDADHNSERQAAEARAGSPWPSEIREEETDRGLVMEDVAVGTKDEAQNGDTLTVHYVGTLADGTKFDSSRDRGAPFTFRLGAGEVIRGWDAGMVGMKVGGTRRLTIPPELGYGARGIGLIPPNSTLHFEVELLGVRRPNPR